MAASKRRTVSARFNLDGEGLLQVLVNEDTGGERNVLLLFIGFLGAAQRPLASSNRTVNRSAGAAYRLMRREKQEQRQ